MTTYSALLKAFLEAPENSQVGLADKIERSQAAVNRYAHGHRFPDADTARLIDQHTCGAVPFATWQSEKLRRLGIFDEPDEAIDHGCPDNAVQRTASPGKIGEISPPAKIVGV